MGATAIRQRRMRCARRRRRAISASAAGNASSDRALTPTVSCPRRRLSRGWARRTRLPKSTRCRIIRIRALSGREVAERAQEQGLRGGADAPCAVLPISVDNAADVRRERELAFEENSTHGEARDFESPNA